MEVDEAPAETQVTPTGGALRVEHAHGMFIEYDVPIPMDDGVVLRADIFRPDAPGQYPVLLSYGPYGKWLRFQDGYSGAWQLMAARYPDSVSGTTNTYQNWETADPEKWVPHGYACIRVDSRGAGRSPGVADLQSPRETRDLYGCIEWAGTLPWSNGKVGLSGISYYAINQWHVAALKPPHLAAICPWEGASDSYRESIRHGGILSSWVKDWMGMQVRTVQHGLGENGPLSGLTNDWVCGPETLSEEELARNRAENWTDIERHPLLDAYHRAKTPDLAAIDVPLLSAANWGGQAGHLRGNVEGFVQAGSSRKWLEVHGGEHWTSYYTDYGVDLQRRFFDHFLKGEDNGWDDQPRVQLQIRHADGTFTERHESEWPIARTQWTNFHLNADRSLSLEPSGQAAEIAFDALGEGVTFRTAPLERDVEITGPAAARLTVSSSTSDTDLFLAIRLFDPDGKEILFQGAIDPRSTISKGWLRASHRKLDAARSLPYRPWHPHDELMPLVPGEPVDVDVEIWPICIVAPAGYTLALTVLGRDFDHGEPAATLSNMRHPMRGCGPYIHTLAEDRPAGVFDGRTTLHVGGAKPAHITLPVIPRN